MTTIVQGKNTVTFSKITQKSIDKVMEASILDMAIALGASPKQVGSQYFVYCPNPSHNDENTPHTSIHPYKRVWTCFGGGGCGASGKSPVDYYMWHKYGKYDKTKFYVCVEAVAKLLGITIKYEDGKVVKSSGSKQQHTPRPIPKALPPQSNEYCDKVYRAFLSLCPVRQSHLEEWRGRGYSIDDIKLMGFRSVPTKEELAKILQELLDRGYNLERVPGFFQRCMSVQGKDKWYWDINIYNEGYFIPVTDRYGRWCRLRIRNDEGDNKYTWFSSIDNTALETKKFKLRRHGVSSGSELNCAVPLSVKQKWEVGHDLSEFFDTRTVIVTEGEHKAQLSSNRLGIPIIGVPGVGNTRNVLPLVQSWGVKKVIIAFDMDALKSEKKDKDGVSGNKSVRNHILSLYKSIAQAGISTYLLTWRLSDGKGLDDVLANPKVMPMEACMRRNESRPLVIEDLHNIW